MQLPPELVSEKHFPKAFAWLARYRTAREKATASAPKPTKLNGQAAAHHIHRSEYAESGGSVDETDPLGLTEGLEVELYPSDWGCEHKDRGRLVALTPNEVTIAVQSKEGGEIRIHAPRTGFKVKEVDRQ